MDNLNQDSFNPDKLSFLKPEDQLSLKSNLFGYRGEHKDLNDAIECGALHESKGSTTALNLFEVNKAPLLELAEAIQLQRDITALDEYLCGIIVTTKAQNLFMDLRFVTVMIEEYGQELTLFGLVNLAIGFCTCEEFFNKYSNSKVDKTYINLTARTPHFTEI
ncbi:hypothetical protein QTV49_004545 [Vibrio vulnificus]|nr:hypothetical protein [Vibrio vulnificus]